MKKKNIFFTLVFFLFAFVSIYVVMKTNRDCSVEDLLAELQEANDVWVFLAVVCMLGVIVFEGLAIRCLIKDIYGAKKKVRGDLYAAADIYFSAITPSATGGQPASAYFMIMDGVSVTDTTVILLLNLVMYSWALFACGVVSFGFGYDIFFAYEIFGRVLILIGSIVLVGLIVLFLLLLAKKDIVGGIATFFIRILAGVHLIHKREKYEEKLQKLLDKYENCATKMQGKWKLLMKVFFFNVLQRLSQSLVTVFCYLAIGGQAKNIFSVWCVHILAALGANSIPIPGGVGTTDYLLINGFEQVDQTILAPQLELISRGISFYGLIIASILIIGIGYTRNYFRDRKDIT